MRAALPPASRCSPLAGCGGARRPRPPPRLDAARHARRPRRRRLPRARPGRAAARPRRARRRRPARSHARHASGSSPTRTCATRSRPRACRSSTASARRSASTFRPQEALDHAGARRRRCARSNREHPQAVFVTGDIVDNAQANELDTALAVLDGGARATPTPARPATTGVQEADNPDPFYYRPDNDAPRHPGRARRRAARRSRAAGLDAPWYPVLGNHDVLAQGEVPPTPAIEARRHRRPRWSTSLDPRLRPRRRRRTAQRGGRARCSAGGAARPHAHGPRRPAPPPAHARPRRCERLRPPRRATAAGSTTRSTSAPRVRGDRARHVDRAGGVARRRHAGAARVAARRSSQRRATAGSWSSPTTRSTRPTAARPRCARSTPTPHVVAAIAGNRHRNAIEPRASGRATG